MGREMGSQKDHVFANGFYEEDPQVGTLGLSIVGSD